MQKAIFLDRDGVINKELGDYVNQLARFEILPHAIPNMKLLNDAGFLLIVITNQGGIAKGMYDAWELARIHTSMESKLHAHNVRLTAVYYCPHHPDFGNCLCRKPKPLLIQKAIAKYQIDTSRSFFIGDNERDIQASTAAGIAGMRIESNENWSDIAQKLALADF